MSRFDGNPIGGPAGPPDLSALMEGAGLLNCLASALYHWTAAGYPSPEDLVRVAPGRPARWALRGALARCGVWCPRPDPAKAEALWSRGVADGDPASAFLLEVATRPPFPECLMEMAAGGTDALCPEAWWAAALAGEPLAVRAALGSCLIGPAAEAGPRLERLLAGARPDAVAEACEYCLAVLAVAPADGATPRLRSVLATLRARGSGHAYAVEAATAADPGARQDWILRGIEAGSPGCMTMAAAAEMDRDAAPDRWARWVLAGLDRGYALALALRHAMLRDGLGCPRDPAAADVHLGAALILGDDMVRRRLGDLPGGAGVDLSPASLLLAAETARRGGFADDFLGLAQFLGRDAGRAFDAILREARRAPSPGAPPPVG